MKVFLQVQEDINNPLAGGMYHFIAFLDNKRLQEIKPN